MEGTDNTDKVIPELYYLIVKFLCGGPLKETAKTLLKELENVEVLPRRFDWEGNEHAQSYNDVDSQYKDMPWSRLVEVCERTLHLARLSSTLTKPTEEATQVVARLSVLSDSLVRTKPKYASFRPDHTIVRRLVHREMGVGAFRHVDARPETSTFPPRMLTGIQLQRRTMGHLASVYCLVFDCTGRYVITGADDFLVKVWSGEDGRLLASLRGAGSEITDVCVSADGSLLACGSVDRLVRVWCLRTGEVRAVLHAHGGTITSVHWAPPAHTDVRWLASTSTDGSVAFWTCSPEGHFISQPVQYVERMRPGVCHMICAAWSVGGAFLAAGSADHYVRVYNLGDGSRDGIAPGEPTPTRVLEMAVHNEAVDSIAWAHREPRFVSGSKDGTAALWMLHATQWRHRMLQATSINGDTTHLKVTMVCWDRSDAYVLTAVSDHTVRVWCSRTYQQVGVLKGHSHEVYVLEAHPFLPGVILSAGHDGRLILWDVADKEMLSKFHNNIEGQGEGAIFDAKWSAGGTQVAASDSHGHLLLLGIGQGHRLLKELPTELFFHTDYRPLMRDSQGGVLDEQTEMPPHLMPPPFLVDVEGAPHEPRYQRLVRGRENLSYEQLIPATANNHRQLDMMLDELQRQQGHEPVWRLEGVRDTGGSWQGDLHVPNCTLPIVNPVGDACRERIEETCREWNAWEVNWFKREMRRRPVMINTSNGEEPSGPKPRRRPGPKRRQPAQPVSQVSSASRVSAVSVVGESPSHSSNTHSRSDSIHSSLDLTDLSSSSSSSCSEWEQEGPALAPPTRARRRPLATRRYSPSSPTPRKRPERSAAAAAAGPSTRRSSSASPPLRGGRREAACPPSPERPRELPEVYRPGEWLTSFAPKKAPYYPQMGDHLLYFKLGHQRYFEAVSEKDLYKVNAREKPWERTHIYDCELVKVVGIKYVIKPPRIVCLKLASSLCAPRSFTVRYHDMPDVIDFLVLRQQYAAAVQREWRPGDRFRCMIDDSWWTGTVLEVRGPPRAAAPPSGPRGTSPGSAAAWARAAAEHFLALKVRWDNGEVERLSRWDLEPIDPDRLPSEPGGAVPVLAHELEAVLYKAEAHEWPPHGDRASACRTIASHIEQVMSLSVAEPFLAPVDLQQYPSYAMMISYPIDLATIKARFDNLFYRRAAAAQFDVRYLASNAEQFNDTHSPIVRQARLVTDLLLHIISNWHDVNVVAKYHELVAAYHSSDDEPLAAVTANRKLKGGRSHARDTQGGRWREHCSQILRQLLSSPDAAPFQRPVESTPEEAPDYHAVISNPLDLGTIQKRLAGQEYQHWDQFQSDVRLVFSNSRRYNTNTRSRIYSMTVRLSALFEALWSESPIEGRRKLRRGERRAPGRRAPPVSNDIANGVYRPRRHVVSNETDSSDGETLAEASRRRRARGGFSRSGSSDSDDAPLHPQRKGKGVGKNSKARSPSPQPGPSTSTANPWGDTRHNGNGRLTASRSSDDSDEDPLGDRLREGGGRGSRSEQQQSTSDERVARRLRRKRKRKVVSDSSGGDDITSAAGRRRHKSRKRSKGKVKRTRERFTPMSSSSSSSSAAEDDLITNRYESDHSYHPRYSTDDDAPLLLYRQRQENNLASGSGPSTSTATSTTSSSRTANGHSSRGVSLRTRHAPRKYNEDSDEEEDTAAAISKRKRAPVTARHLRHMHTLQVNMTAVMQRDRRAGEGSSTSIRARTSTHSDRARTSTHSDRARTSTHSDRARTSTHSDRARTSTHSDRAHTNGNNTSTSDERQPEPVSISSRGRVRKLTAKARGLLTERE